MFLKMTQERNPKLLDVALSLHQQGAIGPNTYVLDVDAVQGNAGLLAKTARENQIQLYMMTKQFGRNPLLAKRIMEAGIPKAVAVDPWEALTLAKAGIPLGNVGHLVQIPKGMLKEILSYHPEVVTVFSVEKAREIGACAQELGYVQEILLKVVGKNDLIYEGQRGGFLEEELLEQAKEIMTIPGIRIVGCTVFPCFLYNQEANAIAPTENAKTLLRAVALLRDQLGLEITHINGPSATAVASIPLLKQLGITHGEPGHALTGTTPLHGVVAQPEIPAMVYVSEVSHLYGDRVYVYGGGHYRRSNGLEALAGGGKKAVDLSRYAIDPISAENIDYYGSLCQGEPPLKVGDTVIYSYRTQIFVTRAQVALVEGIQLGIPRLIGIYDSLGKKLI